MKRLIFVALCALLLAGCGSKPVLGGGIPPTSIRVPPESARTPEGVKSATPPITFTATPGEKHIDAAGLHLIESFEGYSRCAYWDPFGRVWTVGFGQTHGAYSGFCFASRAAAEANLKDSVEREYEWAIRALDVNFTQNQWDALCSFTYNLGAGIYQGTSLGSDLRSRNFFAATQQMLQYDHAGGVVLQGLKTRREDEVRLFDKGEPKPKPSRRSLTAKREVLRHLEHEHHCLLAPKYGGGRWHKPCTVWRKQGNEIDKELR
jgi:lysozyme